MTEKQIESQILEWLNYQPGIFAFKVNTTGIYDTKKRCFRTIRNLHIHKGTSDIIGCKNGYFFALEVKTPDRLKKANTKPTRHDELQTSFLLAVIGSGGFAARIASLDEVMIFMKAIG